MSTFGSAKATFYGLVSLLIVLSFSANTKASTSENVQRINTFIDSAISGKTIPTEFDSKPKAMNFDLNKELGTDFDSGIAYAAVVSKIVDLKYSQVKSFLTSKGGIYKVVSAVKTQRDFAKIDESSDSLSLKLAIKVPVLDDFQTQDTVKIFEDEEGRGILEWKQIGQDGHLEFNRGVVIVEPAGDKCKILVIGVHVIKREHKIPWLGRGTAAQFAKDHYSNYITALEESLKVSH